MTASPAPSPIDSRGPRFGAGVTFCLALAALVVGLLLPIESTLAGRAASPELILLGVAWLAFGLGTIWGHRANPWGIAFRTLVRPRLAPPRETEDPRPPRFALGIGFVLSTAGLVLHLIGVPYGLAAASAALVVASFLNAFVGLCLGCQGYLLLARIGIIRPRTPLAAP